jgi:hypothetical protein
MFCLETMGPLSMPAGNGQARSPRDADHESGCRPRSLEPALSAVEWEADESTTGPASLMLIDPDRNRIRDSRFEMATVWVHANIHRRFAF